ncbi:MAG TPA: hypothetical protein VNF47_21880 [Streptosporangiaceae bacterium]|nr:hypothetical protein [Streptosporangiaceae bacterium]
MAPFVQRTLHCGGSAYGALMSPQAVGGIIGGTAIAMNAHRLSVRTLVGVGALLLGLLDLLPFLYPLVRPALWPAAVLIVLAGVSSAACLVGIIVSGVLGDVIGIVPVIAARGAGYVLVGMRLICVFGAPAASVEMHLRRQSGEEWLGVIHSDTGRQINVC